MKMGLVSSLARPGGNITGATTLNLEVAAKRLELMHELLPNATNIALLVNPADPLAATASRATSEVAAALGLKLHVLSASSEKDLAPAFDTMRQLRAEALVITTATFFNTLAGELGRLSVSHRVPAVYEHREFTAGGGLMSYSGDLARRIVWSGSTLAAFSRARNLPTCQFNRSPTSNCTSIFRPPRRSVLPFRCHCSAAPMR